MTIMKNSPAASVDRCSRRWGLPATPLFADSLTCPNGNLAGAGNDGWTQTGTLRTSPIQVSVRQASLSPSGQDVYAALPGAIITLADNTTLYMRFDLTPSAAQVSLDGAGGFFIYWAPAVGSTVGSTAYHVNRGSENDAGDLYVNAQRFYRFGQ